MCSEMKAIARVNAQHWVFGLTVSLGQDPCCSSTPSAGQCEIEAAPEGDGIPLEMRYALR